MKKVKIILYICFFMLAAISTIILYHCFISQRFCNIKNLKVDVNYQIKQIFAPEGIKDIALITMVKDESDIIFENLVWHFSIGFRKFIIVDNNSSDGTLELIREFAHLTKNKAQIFIIEDPITAYIQTRIITGAYHYVNYFWPEVKWVFPVDADEFWVSEDKLSDILAKIPESCDAITVLRTRYFASKDYYNYPEDTPFYEKIPLRQNKLSTWNNKTWNWKIAVRSGKKEISIAEGNHSVKKAGIFLNPIKYTSGNIYGLHMTEYTMRSIAQTEKKLSNGLRAVILAKKNGFVKWESAPHWWRYEKDIKQYGLTAARIRFEETFINPNEAIRDPLPINEAFVIFKEIVSQ